MARNEQLIRQHKLLQVLEQYRFGRLLEELRDELVEELGLSSLHTRTVKRDLEALQAAGIDVDVHDIVRGKVWKLGPRFRGSHKITATASELMALSLGRDLLYPLAGTPFWQGIESFWNKIQDELPGSVWDHYEKYRRVLYVLGMPAKSYADKHGILKTINRASVEHRVVAIEYQSLRHGFSKRLIEPYAVVFYESSLYIIAADHQVDEGERIRHWKLDRFKRATLVDEWFTPLSDNELDQYLSQSIGIFSGRKTRQFKVRISSYAARLVIENPWHPQQKVAEQSDGSIILTVKASHELEVIPRVMALGTEAEILAPASCRRQMAEMISELATLYDD